MWLYFKVCEVSVRRASEAKQGMILENHRVVFCGGSMVLGADSGVGRFVGGVVMVQ